MKAAGNVPGGNGGLSLILWRQNYTTEKHLIILKEI